MIKYLGGKLFVHGNRLTFAQSNGEGNSIPIVVSPAWVRLLPASVHITANSRGKVSSQAIAGFSSVLIGRKLTFQSDNRQLQKHLHIGFERDSSCDAGAMLTFTYAGDVVKEVYSSIHLEFQFDADARETVYRHRCEILLRPQT